MNWHGNRWWLLTLLLCPFRGGAQPSFQQTGSLLVMSNGNVSLQYDLSSGNCAFYWQNRAIIQSFYSGAGLSTGYIKGTNYTAWSWEKVGSNEVAVTAPGSHPTMKQYFTLDETNSFLVRLEMDGPGVSANWLGPVVVDRTGGVNIGSPGDLRALFVPFDNDHFISYNAMSINSSDTSYEVGAFYDNVSRAGLVAGSINHDTWKSGIYWSGSNNALNQMNVFAGAVSSSVTWDVMPHGSISGNSISSPAMFVGYGPDWRVLMQSFAAENTSVAPPLAWTNGVPFGWNSWGVLQTTVNYQDATNASAFIKQNLQGSNFINNGVVYVNLDSYWDNLNASQLQSFVKYCHANGQKAGIYWTPWVFWGAPDQVTNWPVEGTSYTYDQVVLRNSAGGMETNDGGIALDPTHPGTLGRVNYYINEFTNWGFDYLKLDFLTHGTLEGAHYNTNITTGIQAYNLGMEYLLNQIHGSMFLSESIAPIFPYQYGHSRRISCDVGQSSIANIQYLLNSVSYGWWIDDLYAFNDPDIMVLAGVTTNEEQSRVLSAAITGLFLDTDSLTNAASQDAAVACLTNNAVNAVARAGRTFVAMEGNTGVGASPGFAGQIGNSYYAALFNYSSDALVTNLNLARAGISGVFAARDLWNGALLPVTNSEVNVSLNGAQGRLFQLLNVPTLQSPTVQAGVLNFNLAGNVGAVYAVQASPDLSHWSTIAIVTNLSDTTPVAISNASPSTQFYRVAAIQ